VFNSAVEMLYPAPKGKKKIELIGTKGEPMHKIPVRELERYTPGGGREKNKISVPIRCVKW